MLGLYLHVPFCSAICHYCNFNRGLHDEALASRYVEAIVSHVRTAGAGEPVDTIYFGGGTPSLLSPGDLDGILSACRDAFDVQAGAEISLEANPETVDVARLAGFRAAGVTRLSFGVQSFRDADLRRLGRIHDAARARAAVAEARTAGFDNLSLDLMMWLPGQSVADWLASVDALIEVGPEHASLYLLELYPNAPLQELMARQQWSQTAEDDAADMYEQAMTRLAAAGLARYEISNVARPGRQCRHNLKYWEDGEWLAFGPGAHGRRGGERVRLVAGVEDYIERVRAGVPPIAERHPLTSEEACADALFMGLRLTRGVSLAGVHARYGVDVLERYGAGLEPAIDAGLLAVEAQTMRLTGRGMLLANEVMQVFV